MNYTSFPFEPEALIFDLDGTLLDTMAIHYSCWDELLGKHNISFPRQRFYQMAGISTQRFADIVTKENHLPIKPELLGEQKDQMFIAKQMVSPIIKETFHFVETYYKKIPLAIATGALSSIAHRQLQLAGIDQYFNVVVCSDDVDNPKPAPDVFLQAARLLEVDPCRCVAFEDGDPGIAAIKAAGMFPVDVRLFTQVQEIPDRPSALDF